MTLFIAGVLIALVISALCSVMEATLLSLTPAQVATLSQQRPRIGRIWQDFKSDVERPIAVILLLNTAAHTIGASIAGAQFGKVFGEEHLWIFAGVFTFVMLQFTEILAKSLGVRLNRTLALVIARPLQLSVVVLRPVLWFVHLINRPFEPKREEGDEEATTIGEIRALASLARIRHQINPEQERIIATAPKLSQYRVRDIQIPRNEVAWLDSTQSLEEAITHARRFLHTRFPVCRGSDFDDVIGYANVKEMLFLATDDIANTTEAIPVRPVLLTLGDDSAADLLNRFIRERIHIAVVKDDAGKTTGIVTFEDVVEELVGDIRDEFDRLPRHVAQSARGRWRAGGGLPIAQLGSTIGVELPGEPDRRLTAWLEERIEGPMNVGSSAEIAGLRFTVERLRRGSLYECEIQRLETADA